MKIRELMTRGVESLRPEDSIQDAANRMRSLDVGAMPVCENHRIVGMITDRDIAVRAVAQGTDPTSARVRDAMSDELTFCYEDDDVEHAVQLMEEKQIRRLPILDANKHLVGIVSLGDLATRGTDDRMSGEALQQISEPSPPASQHRPA